MAELLWFVLALIVTMWAVYDTAHTLRTAFAWDQHVDDAMRIADFDRWEREYKNWKANL